MKTVFYSKNYKYKMIYIIFLNFDLICSKLNFLFEVLISKKNNPPYYSHLKKISSDNHTK